MDMNKLARFACVVVLAVVAVVPPLVPGCAQQPDPAARPVDSIARANGGTVSIVSGGVDGTYVRIASDLAAVLDDGDRLRVLPVLGKGSLQNISDILYLRGIDIGIVQSDVLAYASSKQLYAGITQSIQYITKLYDEEVHVLARRDIAALQDLAGKPVNVDVVGSGTAMTASVLFDGLHIAIHATNDDQAKALEKLRHGDIAALVYVSGKPARLFSGLTADSGLHFLAVPITAPLLDTYLPAQFTHADYPELVQDSAPVDTIAVGSVMATFAWQPNSDRYKKVARFVDAFFSKFQLFTQAPRHPKWKEVNLAAQVPGWTRFGPAQDWLAFQAVTAKSSGTQEQDFDGFLARISSPGANLTTAQKEALFREFLVWQSKQNRAP
jgi:TRAP transporter TAXI family solute receptor